MKIDDILAHLRAERDRYEQAIRALEAVPATPPTTSGNNRTKRTKTRRRAATSIAPGPAVPLLQRIAHVLQKSPYTAFGAQEMTNRLIEQGWTTHVAKPMSIVGIALANLTKAGGAERVAQGQYRYRARTSRRKAARSGRTILQDVLQAAEQPLTVPEMLPLMRKAGWRTRMPDKAKGLATMLGQLVRAGGATRSTKHPRRYAPANSVGGET